MPTIRFKNNDGSTFGSTYSFSWFLLVYLGNFQYENEGTRVNCWYVSMDTNECRLYPYSMPRCTICHDVILPFSFLDSSRYSRYHSISLYMQYISVPAGMYPFHIGWQTHSHWAIVIPHVRPTLFQMFSSVPSTILGLSHFQRALWNSGAAKTVIKSSKADSHPREPQCTSYCWRQCDPRFQALTICCA